MALKIVISLKHCSYQCYKDCIIRLTRCLTPLYQLEGEAASTAIHLLTSWSYNYRDITEQVHTAIFEPDSVPAAQPPPSGKRRKRASRRTKEEDDTECSDSDTISYDSDSD